MDANVGIQDFGSVEDDMPSDVSSRDFVFSLQGLAGVWSSFPVSSAFTTT